MNSPGRSKHTQRDRDRAGSGTERTADAEADIVVPVVGGVPVAVRGAEVLGIVVPGPAAQNTTTRGCSGFKGLGQIKATTPEDRVA
jgi:hypothetical protein